jgi:hypothetical protein
MRDVLPPCFHAVALRSFRKGARNEAYTPKRREADAGRLRSHKPADGINLDERNCTGRSDSDNLRTLQKMAADNKSLVEFAHYRQGLKHFEFFLVGVSVTLSAYVGLTLHPEKLTILSAYTIELVSLALLIVSAALGLRRVESLAQIRRWNGELLDSIEKRGAVMVSKPNSEGLIVIENPGRLLTMEAAADWVTVLNEKIPVLHHMIEKETKRAEHLYKLRNRLLLIGFCGVILAKILTPYLQSY